MKKRLLILLSFVLIFSMFMAACATEAVEEPEETEEVVVEEPEETEEAVVEEPEETEEEQEAGEAFELYLVADTQITGPDLSFYELDELELAEDPILSTSDIVNYQWDFHMIDLTPEAFQKILAILSVGIPNSGIPFVVVSHGERIYAGAFWTPSSSLPFDGVLIMHPFDPAGSPLVISLGYPSEEYFTGEDPRSDPRLRQALEDAELLGE